MEKKTTRLVLIALPDKETSLKAIAELIRNRGVDPNTTALVSHQQISASAQEIQEHLRAIQVIEPIDFRNQDHAAQLMRGLRSSLPYGIETIVLVSIEAYSVRPFEQLEFDVNAIKPEALKHLQPSKLLPFAVNK